MLNYSIYSASGDISFEKPVMVLIHGLGGGYANWVYQVRHLKKQYDLLLIELPSHGKSPYRMSELELNFASISELIVEVLDHLGIRKATFAGLSLGTLIVKHIVLTYPERVDKYILVGPVGKYTFLLKSAIRFALFLLPVVPLKFAVTLVCLVFMPYRRLSYGRNMFLASAQRVGRQELIAWFKTLQSFAKTQKEYSLKMKDEAGGLYIVGELDHFFLTMLRCEMKRIKNLAVVKNGGHVCNIDQYEAVNALIVEFQECDCVVVQ